MTVTYKDKGEDLFSCGEEKLKGFLTICSILP